MGLRERPFLVRKRSVEKEGLFPSFFLPFGNLLEWFGQPFIGTFWPIGLILTY
jgi:hypothetical protein